ncbi:hypothetical protein ETAA8_45960 [Anatilimnocola aggregata]|uniref:Uncharacterized protein n=2 Tax=Anatilimnocola aggregata TaxID=2528021 RepID=A0A517YGW9_9BACT|nr:hypothetical protein ETAA8_45960 [Anatilimnocola aggregata]
MRSSQNQRYPDANEPTDRGLNWDSLADLALPHSIRKIVSRNLSDPPAFIRPAMSFRSARIDHIAIAFASYGELLDADFSLLRSGAKVIDPVHAWPTTAAECKEVQTSWLDAKWMSTLAVGTLPITLLAPMIHGDLISQYVSSCGRADIHHVAFAVEDIDSILGEVGRVLPELRQISVVAIDEALSQVFLRSAGDPRICELIERRSGFGGFFTCKNIAALTQGLRQE